MSINFDFSQDRAVILCICQRVTDRQVDVAIQEGARSLADVGKACNAGTGCGCCHRAIARRIEHARDGVCGGQCAACPRRLAAVASVA